MTNEESGSRKDHLRNAAGEVREQLPRPPHSITNFLNDAKEAAQAFEDFNATRAVKANIDTLITKWGEFVALCETTEAQLDALFSANELPA